MPLKLNAYQHYQKIKRKKINGHLKSSLRKKEPDVAYNNIINSEYMFSEYLNLEKNKEIKYSPKILVIQIILNLLLFGLTFYLLEFDWIFESLLLLSLIFFNWFVIWIYSFTSIIKNKFRKKSNKYLWFLLVLFLPFTALFYLDLKHTQIIKS